MDQHLSPLDVVLLGGLSGLRCTLQDGGGRLGAWRAAQGQGLVPLQGLGPRAAQRDGSALADGDCEGSEFKQVRA